jgi:hypothetical protein
MILSFRPRRGGFLRPFGCGWFIREFLAGSGPYASPPIDPERGAPQSDIFYYYKQSLRLTTAEDRAARYEERAARKEKRLIDPTNIEDLIKRYLERLPYKSRGCRYHSFVKYFSILKKLDWVEPSGVVELSTFQDNYPEGSPRIFYRLTPSGWSAPDQLWTDPRRTLYG